MLHFASSHHKTNRSIKIALLLFAGSSVALAGCRANFNLGSSTLDSTKAETLVGEMIASQLGVTVQSVSCPDDVPIAANTTFQCQVQTNENDAFAVDVTQKDDQGNVQAQTPTGLLSLNQVEQNIQQTVEQQLKQKVTADCGGALKVVMSGETFECQVTDAQGTARTARVTATSNDGQVSWEI